MNALLSLVCCLLALVPAPPATPPVPDEQITVVDTTRTLPCICCPNPIEGEHNLISFRGRNVHVHQGDCTEHWHADRDRLFRNLQPKGALFDEDGVVTGMRAGWLLFGFYVLAGLISGAGCAYLAVAKGHGPREWFLLGLFFNVPALLTALLMSRRDVSSLPQGVPAGLRKVPTTRAPVTCAGCGAELHPAARVCPECGMSREPTAEAETERL